MKLGPRALALPATHTEIFLHGQAMEVSAGWVGSSLGADLGAGLTEQGWSVAGFDHVTRKEAIENVRANTHNAGGAPFIGKGGETSHERFSKTS